MKLQLNIDLDLTELADCIEQSDNLEALQLFTGLSSIVSAKSRVLDCLDQISSLEGDIKGLIDAKAKALIGDDWSAIKGDGFKITKSYAGQVYELAGEPKKEFITIKLSPNTKAIEEYRLTHEGKIPSGVAINENRTPSIRITLK